MRLRPIVLVLFAAVLIVLPGSAQSTDPHFGLWKLNEAKSKRDPSSPAPRSSTRKYEPFEGDGVRLTVESVDAKGQHTTGGYAAHFDGKPYRDLGKNPWDSIVIKKSDPYTYSLTLLAKGSVYSTNTSVVSKDGKTMTVTSTRKDESGKTITSVTVFDKQ